MVLVETVCIFSQPGVKPLVLLYLVGLWFLERENLLLMSWGFMLRRNVLAPDAAQSLANLAGVQGGSSPGKPTDLSNVPYCGFWVGELHSNEKSHCHLRDKFLPLVNWWDSTGCCAKGKLCPGISWSIRIEGDWLGCCFWCWSALFWMGH